MTTINTTQTIPAPPRGLKRLLWRIPIWLYRLHFGWLLGKRFLLLTHTGRKSGLTRQAVVEVIRHDPIANIYYVASGFGEKSDWFRNVSKSPEVTIQVGRQTHPALAQRLPIEDAVRELLDYRRRHPAALRNLSRILGYQLDETDESVERLAQAVPVVAFRQQ